METEECWRAKGRDREVEQSILACYTLHCKRTVKWAPFRAFVWRWWRASIEFEPRIEVEVTFPHFLVFYPLGIGFVFVSFSPNTFDVSGRCDDNYNCCSLKTGSGLYICMFGHIKCMICFNNFFASICGFLYHSRSLSFTCTHTHTHTLSRIHSFFATSQKFDYFTRDLAAPLIILLWAVLFQIVHILCTFDEFQCVSRSQFLQRKKIIFSFFWLGGKNDFNHNKNAGQSGPYVFATEFGELILIFGKSIENHFLSHETSIQ